MNEMRTEGNAPSRSSRGEEEESPPAIAISGLPQPLGETLAPYAHRLDVDQIRRAYELAVESHAGLDRASEAAGEEPASHVGKVAARLARLRLDTATLVSALLYESFDRAPLGLPEVEEHFGSEVREILDDLVRLGQVDSGGSPEEQVEELFGLIHSMAEGTRAALIMLADRLQTMRSMEHRPTEEQRRIALEAREIFAPLARRLRITALARETDDLAFKVMEPEEYEALRTKVRGSREEWERLTDEMHRALHEELTRAGIPAMVLGYEGDLWPIHQEMVSWGKTLDEAEAPSITFVITDTLVNCYATLAVVHSRWTPIAERFHDYVATPMSNGYRSLHTTIVGSGGRRFELRIRTEEMHSLAEYGMAGHWVMGANAG